MNRWSADQLQAAVQEKNTQGGEEQRRQMFQWFFPSGLMAVT